MRKSVKMIMGHIPTQPFFPAVSITSAPRVRSHSRCHSIVCWIMPACFTFRTCHLFSETVQVERSEAERMRMEMESRDSGEQLREMAEKVFQLLERLKLAELAKNKAMEVSYSINLSQALINLQRSIKVSTRWLQCTTKVRFFVGLDVSAYSCGSSPCVRVLTMYCTAVRGLREHPPEHVVLSKPYAFRFHVSVRTRVSSYENFLGPNPIIVRQDYTITVFFKY